MQNVGRSWPCQISFDPCSPGSIHFPQPRLLFVWSKNDIDCTVTEPPNIRPSQVEVLRGKAVLRRQRATEDVYARRRDIGRTLAACRALLEPWRSPRWAAPERWPRRGWRAASCAAPGRRRCRLLCSGLCSAGRSRACRCRSRREGRI